MKLEDLKRMSGLVSLRALAIACGMSPFTLHSRVSRGKPELTKEEAKQITALLAEHGLRVKL